MKIILHLCLSVFFLFGCNNQDRDLSRSASVASSPSSASSPASTQRSFSVSPIKSTIERDVVNKSVFEAADHAGNHYVVFRNGDEESGESFDDLLVYYDLKSDTEVVISRGNAFTKTTFDVGDLGAVYATVSPDNHLKTDVFYYDFETRESFRVTNHPGNEIEPRIFGTKIIWFEDFEGRSSNESYNIKMCDIADKRDSLIEWCATNSPAGGLTELGETFDFNQCSESCDGVVTNFWMDFYDDAIFYLAYESDKMKIRSDMKLIIVQGNRFGGDIWRFDVANRSTRKILDHEFDIVLPNLKDGFISYTTEERKYVERSSVTNDRGEIIVTYAKDPIRDGKIPDKGLFIYNIYAGKSNMVTSGKDLSTSRVSDQIVLWVGGNQLNACDFATWSHKESLIDFCRKTSFKLLDNEFLPYSIDERRFVFPVVKSIFGPPSGQFIPSIRTLEKISIVDLIDNRGKSTERPVVHYRFEDNLKDAVSGLDLDNPNPSKFASGVEGTKGLRVTDRDVFRIDRSDSLNFKSGVSICLWVDVNMNNGLGGKYVQIFGNIKRGYELDFNQESKKFEFWVNDGDWGQPAVSRERVNGDEGFVHVCGTHVPNGKPLLFVNGVKQLEGSPQGAIVYEGEVALGRDVNPKNNFVGVIDELKVWSTGMDGVSLMKEYNSYAGEVPQPILAYDFEDVRVKDGKTYISDVTQGSRHGVSEAILEVVQGPSGKGIKLTTIGGVGQFISVSNQDGLNPVNGVTVCSSVKVDAQNGFPGEDYVQIIGSMTKGFELDYYEKTKKFQFWVNDGNWGQPAESDQAYDETDGWVHLCGVHKPGSSPKLYVNGVLQTKQGNVQGELNYVGEIVIGGDSSKGNFYSGSLDDVRIYGDALKPLNISTIANSL